MRTAPPAVRQQIRAALRNLEQGRGDRRPLQGRLDGYWRLRVGAWRVVYRHRGGRVECFFAGPRNIVYELLEAQLPEILARLEAN